MKDTEVIAALGGYKVLAPKLAMELENAAHLEKRLTPWRYRLKISQMARRKKIALPSDYLEVRR